MILALLHLVIAACAAGILYRELARCTPSLARSGDDAVSVAAAPDAPPNVPPRSLAGLHAIDGPQGTRWVTRPATGRCVAFRDTDGAWYCPSGYTPEELEQVPVIGPDDAIGTPVYIGLAEWSGLPAALRMNLRLTYGGVKRDGVFALTRIASPREQNHVARLLAGAGLALLSSTTDAAIWGRR